MLEKLVSDKHSSLFQKLINYGQKRFITLGPEHAEVEQFVRFEASDIDIGLDCVHMALTNTVG